MSDDLKRARRLEGLSLAYLSGQSEGKTRGKAARKVLHADAKTNAADWQSASAAMVGVLGIASGLWWMDALAALFISIEICRSGLSEVRTAEGSWSPEKVMS